jgi:hypothetical protein
MQWGAIKTLAAGYMHRKDMGSRFDGLQELVMSDLTRLLDVTENEAAAVFTMAASTALPGLWESPLPDDFGRPKVFQIGALAPLEPTTLINLIGNNRTDQYAIVGRKVITRNASPMTGSYGQRVAADITATAENLFMEFYPTAVLYSLLVHACESIQDFDAVGAYTAKLDDAVGIANQNKAWAELGAGSAPQSGYANP